MVIDGSIKDKHSYPRPLMEREQWTNLNGWWEFAIDAEAQWSSPNQVDWGRKILVPFSPETKSSGIHDTGFYRAVWYRREFETPELSDGKRLQIHFGAVDYSATVWINGRIAGKHDGGYTPFFLDITDLLNGNGTELLEVRAEDDPADLTKPRGKQDWQLAPHSIWYPRTTGIWQTVWLETVSSTHLDYIRWTPVVERWEIGFETRLRGARRTDLRLHIRLQCNDKVLADDVYSVVGEEMHRKIALSDPGIDDSRNELLWSPQSPILIRAHIRLIDSDGAVLDEFRSYTALRSISIQGDRFVLNGRPFPLQLVLDQGYFPDTGITAPDDNALRRDVELAKAMGFNGVRKHQKIEDPRYLYWADTLGLLVWEEMPSAYRFTRTSIERLTREWKDVIRRDISHPCIVAWVPFNESWGVPDLPESPAQRHYVQALYHLTKTLDPARPVIGNDGWESVATDIVGIHDYDDNADRIARRYGKEEQPSALFKRERPGGRLLILSEHAHAGLPIMLTEFGGIAYSENVATTWGYTRSDSAEEFANRYCELVIAVRSVNMLAGFCYTQFADTYQEANGLLYADRTPKFPLKQMALATRGPRNRAEQSIETAWRDRIMNYNRAQQAHPAETPVIEHAARVES
jgi:beta-galactosidase/beta-glucuronidase